MANWCYWQGNTLFLQVKLLPNSRQDSIMGQYSDYIKIRITAPPVDGKANKQLIKFLAKSFAVPERSITIEKGELGRLKLIRIETPKDLSILE